jgi:hypothetical protein
MGCGSFTEPHDPTSPARAMSLVTITDTARRRGWKSRTCPEHRQREITTYFPRTAQAARTGSHTEAHHAEFQRLRENLFDLVPYLRAQGIVHVLAHPLFAVNDRLTPAHFEKALLLFNIFESNGSRDEAQNAFLRQVLQWLRPEDMQRLADKHGIEPLGETPWIKGLVGGSDDHSPGHSQHAHAVWWPGHGAQPPGAVARPGACWASPPPPAHGLASALPISLQKPRRQPAGRISACASPMPC